MPTVSSIREIMNRDARLGVPMSELSVRVVADDLLAPSEWMLFEETGGRVTLAITQTASRNPAIAADVSRACRVISRGKIVRVA